MAGNALRQQPHINSSRPAAALTVLNTMAGRDAATAFAQHRAWNLRWLDLKDQLWGAAIEDITDEQANTLAALAREYGLQIYCLSTQLFGGVIEDGEAAFASRHLGRVNRIVAIARILKPRFIRLLAAKSRSRPTGAPLAAHLAAQAPWLAGCYEAAARTIAAAGFEATLENETSGCVLSSVDDINDFFALLGADAPLSFTWDIQNLWHCGVFPSVSAYRAIRAPVKYVHLKGGQADHNGRLAWRSSLAEASWPVREIVQAVLADRTSPVLCLNPSHGSAPPGYAAGEITVADLAFLRRNFPDIE